MTETDDTPIEEMTLDAEGTVRAALETAKARLADKRIHRDALNQEIKDLVRDVELLGQATHVFDRAARKTAKEVKKDGPKERERDAA